MVTARKKRSYIYCLMPVKRKSLTSQWFGCSVRVRLRCIHCLLNSLGGNEPMRNHVRLYAVLLGLALIFGGRARADDDPTCEDFGMFPGGQKAACDDSCSETCKRKQNCGGNQCPGGYCWACPAPKDPPPNDPPPCVDPSFNSTNNQRTVHLTGTGNVPPAVNWDFGDTWHCDGCAPTVTHAFGGSGCSFSVILTAFACGHERQVKKTVKVCGGSGGGGDHDPPSN